MVLALIGVAVFALGIWLIFALSPTAQGTHPALNWPTGDMLVPVGIVMLIATGPMLVVYGLQGN